MIESFFLLTVAIWLYRLGRDLQRLGEEDDHVTTFRIGKS
jgi:hypothetical protein